MGADLDLPIHLADVELAVFGMLAKRTGLDNQSCGDCVFELWLTGCCVRDGIHQAGGLAQTTEQPGEGMRSLAGHRKFSRRGNLRNFFPDQLAVSGSSAKRQGSRDRE